MALRVSILAAGVLVVLAIGAFYFLNWQQWTTTDLSPLIAKTDLSLKGWDARVDETKTLLTIALAAIGVVGGLLFAKKDEARILISDRYSLTTLFIACAALAVSVVVAEKTNTVMLDDLVVCSNQNASNEVKRFDEAVTKGVDPAKFADHIYDPNIVDPTCNRLEVLKLMQAIPLGAGLLLSFWLMVYVHQLVPRENTNA